MQSGKTCEANIINEIESSVQVQQQKTVQELDKPEGSPHKRVSRLVGGFAMV